MRHISFAETQAISGGLSQQDINIINQHIYKAGKDAFNVTLATTAVLVVVGGGLLPGAGAAPAIGAALIGTAIFAAPYVWIYSYRHSSEWNILNQ